MSYATQSNTRSGHLVVKAAVDLTNREGELVALNGFLDRLAADDLQLSGNADQQPLFVVVEGGPLHSNVVVAPLVPGQTVRIRTNGLTEIGKPVIVKDGESKVINYANRTTGSWLLVGLALDAVPAGGLVEVLPYIYPMLVEA